MTEAAAAFPSTTHREKLERLSREAFDVLVIGGGINGVGIAREAALRGLRTALIDKGDFASGTSSKSSKLIHGGLRYLQEGDLGLVLEASRERDLLRRLAPHLVRPIPFFFPVYRGGPVPLWKLRLGLVAYDVLAAFRNIARHRIGKMAWAEGQEPRLRREGLRGAALYYDCFTDDARLVLETMLGAEEAGAVCLNYVALDGFEKDGGRLVAVTARSVEGDGSSLRIAARSIVNATGPWLDSIRQLDDSNVVPLLRRTKGVHLIVPRERVGHRNAIVLHAIRDGRILFVIPWEEQSIVGTTDTDFTGSPDSVTTESEDVDYLLETVNHYFPAARLTDRDVVASYAGLRPLIAGGVAEAPSAVSREEAIVESASGLVSIGGGKLTTYRRVAVRVIDRVAERLMSIHGIHSRRRSGTDRRPLPGGDPSYRDTLVASGSHGSSASAEDLRYLAERYGSRCRSLASALESDPSLARRLSSGTPDMLVQAWFGAVAEMAVRVEDVLRRRTQVAFRTFDQGVGAADLAAEAMASPLGWDEKTKRRRVEEFRATAGESWRAESLNRKKA
ncbi:MAG: glycerol-3-phosphate dehydrogenase [Candidatus Binatota bacterium]|nr:glycerol-3-phosphate dehydrogenase [Candidatus Binatota bacterium]